MSTYTQACKIMKERQADTEVANTYIQFFLGIVAILGMVFAFAGFLWYTAMDPLAFFTLDKDPVPIELQADGKWNFDVDDSKIYSQNLSKSYEYNLVADLRASVQLLDNLNYRLVLSPKLNKRKLLKICKSIKDIKNIVSIQVPNCDGVTNDFLKAVSENVNISDLAIDGCGNFDDKGLGYLSKSKHLKRLGLYGDSGVTGDGIRTIMKNCKSLDAIGIDGIRLSPEFVSQLHSDYHGQIKIHHHLVTCECSK